MRFVDIGLAILTLYGLSAGTFWLSVRGWLAQAGANRADRHHPPRRSRCLRSRKRVSRYQPKSPALPAQRLRRGI
jgi:hypothetical protein